MKEYPVDNIDWLIFWPMTVATRTSSKPLKLLLVVTYFIWCLPCMLILFPVLIVSVLMALWDDVSEDLR